jgi:hypothetical protein
VLNSPTRNSFCVVRRELTVGSNTAQMALCGAISQRVGTWLYIAFVRWVCIVCFDTDSCVLNLTDGSLPSPTSHEDVKCRHEELVSVSLVNM